MDLRALIFVPALVAAALCVFAFCLFAAHYYLTVLESTAAGGKEVTWVSEPITDNFWKPFYMAWLLCLWLGPAYVIGRSLATTTQLAWVGFAVPVLVAWLLYPVSQLSSLSAMSVWVPLHPQVFARLAQRPGATAGFYAITLPVFALGGLAFRWAFLTADEWHLLFLGAPLFALAVLVYGRLLGRVAFALLFTRDLLKRKRRKKPKPEREPAAPEPAAPEPQPAELPPINTPLDGEVCGYNILTSDEPPVPKKRVLAEVADEEAPAPSNPGPPPARAARGSDHPLDRGRTWTDDDDDATPYAMNPSEVNDSERVPAEVLTPRPEEMALLERSDTRKPPKRLWTAEVMSFLAQPDTIAALLILSGIACLAGAAVRVARQFNPAAGE